MLARSRLEHFLNAFPRLTLGLVGDLFLDRYLELLPGEELSIETGLEAYQIAKVRNAPGALGTVMNNLAALGIGLLVPVTLIGDDGHGYDLLREVRRLPADASHVLCSNTRLTPTYTKPMRPTPDGWRELNRLDVRTRAPLSEGETEALCQHIAEVFQSSDGLIVLDQIVADEQGVINAAVRNLLLELHRSQPDKLIYIDSRARLAQFDCGILKGNLSEVAGSFAAGTNPAEAARAALEAHVRRTRRPAYCTLGDQGVLVVSPEAEPVLAPAFRADGPVDIVGAGDAATSGIVASLLAGASPVEAAAVGNLVASSTVQQLGTTGTATPAQVRARFQEQWGNA
jgi:bifunctional ADP-heptose synthase (sugar kinase/adenylyltransferase)